MDSKEARELRRQIYSELAEMVAGCSFVTNITECEQGCCRTGDKAINADELRRELLAAARGECSARCKLPPGHTGNCEP